MTAQVLVIFAVGDLFMTMMMLMFEKVRVVNGPQLILSRGECDTMATPQSAPSGASPPQRSHRRFSQYGNGHTCRI